MLRWLSIIITAILGIALGLFYGWKIDPVQYTDITPDFLRSDYRTDYVLMVAEAYQVEEDPALAAQRLAVLGSQLPAAIAEEAEAFAQQSEYPVEDQNLLQELTVALQAWQPVTGTSQP